MAAEIKTSLRVRARFRWIQLGGYGTAIKLCKGNYGSPPIVLFPHGEPCGSRESGYRFVRDFIISSRDEGEEEREREEFLVICYFVVGGFDSTIIYPFFLINFSIFPMYSSYQSISKEEKNILKEIEEY